MVAFPFASVFAVTCLLLYLKVICLFLSNTLCFDFKITLNDPVSFESMYVLDPLSVVSSFLTTILCETFSFEYGLVAVITYLPVSKLIGRTARPLSSVVLV